MASIKEVLYKEYMINLTEKQLLQTIEVILKYEVRDDHPLALNTPLVGHKKIIFNTNDRDILFEIFNREEMVLSGLIKKMSSIASEWKVVGDEFNILVVWLLHLAKNNKSINRNIIDKFMFCLLNYLQYKFFSSFVNYCFKHTVDETIMRSTIESLTGKFSIIKYKTWKNVIQARTKYYLSEDSVHKTTIEKFNDDKKIIYLISDAQTRIRNQIVKINQIFYEKKDMQDAILNYTNTTEVDGAKLIKDINSTYDLMQHYIVNQLFNRNEFINDKYVRLIDHLFSGISYNLLRSFLGYVCELAQDQKINNILNKVEYKEDGIVRYIGLDILIKRIIEMSYKICLRKNININNKLVILKTVRQTFSVPKTNDKELVNIRDSVEDIVLKSGVTKRQVSILSLKVSFVVYIILKSFEMLRVRQ
jgi:hypothetical protein